MKRHLLVLLILVGFALSNNAQTINDPFFTPVSYIGAFDGTNDWTSGWTEWDPVNKVYPAPTVTKGNGLFSRATGTHITSNETWSGTILLDGWIYVDDGAELTIDPGTIIRGTNKSALVIERGGKIKAIGTVDNPIVFTSNQGEGLRANSDWGGIVLCGKAPNNLTGGEGIAEGGIESPYGGTDINDNSGVMKYVRIEFPGYEIATGKEVNGLTFCSVGRNTQIDYVQVSHSGDDGYEWFGGTVNAKHLISYKTEDDDFDTDNGFIGRVQFGVIARDSSIVDTDAANGFESDNNEAGTNIMPKTHAIFSNISAFGPAATASEPTVLRTRHAEGSAMRIRRNSRLQIYNSIFAGFGRGLRIESEGSYTAATIDSLTVQNTFIAGIRGSWFQTDAAAGADAVRDWFLNAERNNDTLTQNSALKITAPFNYSARNFQPMAGSPVFNASSWYRQPDASHTINNDFFTKVTYSGAFDGTNNWTTGWAEWDPQNKVYPDGTTTKGNGLFSRSTGTHIAADETWSGNILLDGWVYVTTALH
ncbi:MAG: T9SS C-terminal target domain-containing protein [Bacteroidales bacterium]|nr:T9SS C-terminal target domain-containing protein [Bacteroidales bacterium]